MKHLSFLLLLAGLTAAQAQRFIEPTPGADWFTSGNWDPAAVPSGGDTAWIDQGYSALLANGASTISQLNLGSSTFGSLVVSGTNAGLNVTNQLAVGFGEEAGSALTIQAGATVTSAVTLIGFTAAGSLTVTGTGSTFIGGTNFASTQIAAGGTFTVSDGAHASTEGGILAFGPAYLNVSGPGSMLTTGDSIFYGDGVVTISNGGTMAHSTNMAFGSENGMIFNVSGTNSAMVAADQYSSLRVGSEGRGVLNISGGATVTSGAASLGASNVSDVGVVTVSGTGSRWNVGQGLAIGDVGTGTMTISDGGSVVSSGQQVIGRTKNGAAGTVVISGTGSSWDTQGNTLMIASASNTLGNLIVTDGGSLNVGGNGVYLAQARTATANVLQTGGTINAGIVSFGVGTSLYQLEGGTLRVGGNGGIAASASGTSTFEFAGGTIQVSGGALTTSVKLTLRTDTTSVIDTQASSATLSGVLSGGGGLNKIGAGTLTLSGSNVHLGGVTLSSGTLSLGNNAALGAGSLVIAGNSTVQAVTAARTLANNLTLGTGVTGTIGGSTNLTLGGTISGGGALAKIGTSTLTLTGSNTYSGGTTLTAGTVNFSQIANFGTGTLSMRGGTLQWATGNTADVSSLITLGTGGVFDTNGNNVTFASSISGAGSLAKAGTGTLVLSASNAYSGNTTVSGGTLLIAHRHALANTGTLSLSGGQFSGSGEIAPLAANILLTASSTIGGTADLIFTGSTVNTQAGNPTLAITNTGSTTFRGNLSLSSNNTARVVTFNTTGGATLISGTIANGGNGAGGIIKTGAGLLTLSANNTYTGTTTVSGGRLQIGIGGATGSISSRLVNNGEVAFNRSDAVIYSGTISGSGSLTQAGTGRLTLTGSNSYSGGTTVSSGTLSVGHKDAVGTGTVVVDGGVYLIEIGVSATNSVTISSGAFSRSLSASSSLVHAVDASSVATFATLLAGETSAATTLLTSFSATSAAANDEFRRSDVYSFQGSGADIFTLQLSFTATSPDSYLGWLNGTQWENAVDGNTGNNALSAQQGYVGSFSQFQLAYGNDLSQYIGAWGMDVVGGTTKVWAVLNHNSDFSIVPEPGARALVMLGVGTLLVSRRRK